MAEGKNGLARAQLNKLLLNSIWQIRKEYNNNTAVAMFLQCV